MESNSDCEAARSIESAIMLGMEDAAIHAGEPNIFVRMPVWKFKEKIGNEK